MAKVLFGVWGEIHVSQLNRVLRPFDVRLVVKKSKEWGDRIAITASRIDAQAPEINRLGQVVPPENAGYVASDESSEVPV